MDCLLNLLIGFFVVRKVRPDGATCLGWLQDSFAGRSTWKAVVAFIAHPTVFRPVMFLPEHLLCFAGLTSIVFHQITLKLVCLFL